MIRILQQDNRITKAIFAVIIGAAIIAMVITLVPGIFDNGSTNDANVYAIVRSPGFLGRLGGDSKTIKMDQVNRIVQAQMRQQNLPPMYSMLFVPRVEQQMVTQAVLAREADKLGLAVSNADLRRELRTGSLGQYIFPSGNYIGDDAYLSFVQNAFQMSVVDFEDEVKSDIELQRLEAMVTGGLTVSDTAVRNEYKMQGTKVKFDYAVVSSADLKKGINPTDADLEAFFKQNAPRYASAVPETRKIVFFSFDASNLKDKPTVTDADIQAYYSQHQAQYKVEEQVQTRHILIPVAKGADAKTEAAAKAKAQDVLNQVKAGGNFGKLAKKYSEDPGSKEKGGELPMIPTAGLDPAYAKAAMALSPGQTSDLVRSQFGYHIIQTVNKDSAHNKSLPEVKDSISPILMQQKAGASEQAFAQQLADEAKKNGMQKTADAHGLHLTTTDYVGREGVIGSLADASGLLSQAFTQSKGAAPATASTGDGYAVFQVEDIRAAHAPAFADYKTNLLNDYREQKAPELLNQQLAKLGERAKVLNDLKKAAAELNVPVKSSDLVGKDGQVPDVGAMTGQAAVALSLAKGAISGPINTGASGVVLQVTDKQEPSDADIAQNFAATREKLLSTQRQEFFNIYAENLVAQYEKAGAIVTSQKKSPASPAGSKVTEAGVNMVSAAQERISGVLLHVTSLPSRGGVGDFGPAAYQFVDFLVAAKQRMWQVLPLNPTGYGSSPYSALSAFAGNSLLISLDFLARDGWISADRIAELPGAEGPCDFGLAFERKQPLIEEAAANFLDHCDDAQRQRFQRFCQDNISWLTDYAMFNVLRRANNYASWHEWPEGTAMRKSEALTQLMNERGRELAVEQVVQFFFTEQWTALRCYCAERKVKILGDVAIFVSYDSADVWTHPEIFELDDQRKPLRVSGVPPDYFSSTGQRWGNPLYKWSLLQEHGFDWWVARIRRSLALYDSVRLDHFRGFEAYWSIAADEETALNGQWVKAPGGALFHRLKEVFGELPFIAEDLGLITREVDELREFFGMPGMRILQFGFADRGGHMYLPHRCVPNTVTYTGTHDNNTTLGWWREDATDIERANVQTYLQPIAHEGEIVWAMIKAAARSVANICIFPLQDILHLGSDARMNTPGAGQGNWTWRYAPDALHADYAIKLTALMEMTDRDGYQKPIEGMTAGQPSDEAHLRVDEGAEK